MNKELIMNKELFAQYAELKLQQRDVEAQIEKISPQLVNQMVDGGADKVQTDAGTFVIVHRKQWSFTDKVKHQEDVLKTIKENEMANGDATFVERPTLTFFEPKI